MMFAGRLLDGCVWTFCLRSGLCLQGGDGSVGLECAGFDLLFYMASFFTYAELKLKDP